MEDRLATYLLNIGGAIDNIGRKTLGGAHKSGLRGVKVGRVLGRGGRRVGVTARSRFFLSGKVSQHMLSPAGSMGLYENAMSILELSRASGYENRNLVSACVAVGESLGLFYTARNGRAKLVTTTPVFKLWRYLENREFGGLAEKIRTSMKEMDEAKLRNYLYELRRAFKITELFEKDPLAARRFEILAGICSTINLSHLEGRKLLKEVADKLDSMHVMAEAIPEEILEGFEVRREGGKLILEWTESGSEEKQARRS